MQKKKQKQGISLIVLVITIIVMIILATTVIISLNNNGIISKANEAVEKTNESEVKELANLAWTDAYIENRGKSEEKLLLILKEAVNEALDKNNVNKEEYVFKVTTKGVELLDKEKVWVQKSDRTVVKGDTTLNIGDYVSYVSGVSGYTDTNGWQVLGAENGELLVMSATDVSRVENYEPGMSELNKICEPYGKGENALGARSITLEDVDRVTGYDKTTYGKGTIEEYGNTVTYSYNGTEYPAYSGTNGVTGTLTEKHKGESTEWFCWLDNDGHFHRVVDLTKRSTGIITEDNVEAIITSTYYEYDASNDTNLREEAPNAYNMLFGLNDNYDYFLASLEEKIKCGSNCVVFGRLLLKNGNIAFGPDTRGSSTIFPVMEIDDWGVRAVVALSSDFNPSNP